MRGLFAPPKGVDRRKRAHRSGAITFCLVGLTVSIFAVYSILRPTRLSAIEQHGIPHSLQRRSLNEPHIQDLECRLVHEAEDKCAFVKENCPDEQAGLFSYLDLYYCSSPTAKPFAFSIIVLWMCVLFSTIGIAASDFFCINLSTIATLLGLSESLAGVTFLAFGNGSPDVFSTFSAMSTNSGSLAIGELIGAASFITAVVAGAMAFVRPFKVAKKSFVRDVVFFIIAASLSMVFLYDGKLYLWEAAAMVGIYVFYVIFVVTWHWWFNRRRKSREREAAVRAQFVAPGSEDLAFPAYHDEDENDGPARPNPGRGISAEDFSALERGRSGDGANDYDDDEEEELEDRRKRWLGEINSDMRLSRPRERRLTHNPVRPSLIGALEFRSILSGLHKSGNIQSIPLNLRRYSDDARVEASGVNADALSIVSEPRSRAPYELEEDDNAPSTRPFLNVGGGLGGRSRAVSAPDADAMRLNVANIPTIDLLGPLAEDDGSQSDSRRPSGQAENGSLPPPSPTISLSPPGSHQGSRATSPIPAARARSPSDLLTIPGAVAHAKTSNPQVSPTKKPPQPPKLNIPQGEYFPVYQHGLSPASAHRAPSIRVPPTSGTPLSEFPFDLGFDITGGKPLKWWPYKILPAPFELWATLFPTLCGWTAKNWWERFLGVIAAPSVFLLTITLPVVETEPEEQEQDDDIPDLTLPGGTSYLSDHTSRTRSRTNVSIIVDAAEPSPEELRADQKHSLGAGRALQNGLGGHGTTATVAASTEHLHQLHDHAQAPLHPHHRSRDQLILSPSDRTMIQSPEQLPALAQPKLPSPKDWCRWLVILQAYIAPLFIVLIFWAKMEPESPKALIKPTLIALACSSTATAFVLLTTTATRAPKWRVVMCFLGFIVSITWISTIADEVVGVLKTIGVILNISDAILGLTIFAVGNSLGDLVADYTVAKLGYPVMALSACFGGPMLNILLGVGCSGLYLTIKGAKDKQARHPERELKFKPYHIEVSRTLMISGVTLLVTLTGLLIVVPLRRWKMDRFIGWGLFIVWTVSTVSNVLVEVLGVGAATS